MRIYLNGDSHTSGTFDVISPEEAELPFALHLVNKLNGTLIDNPAIGGASNDRIMRTTEKFLWRCEEGLCDWPDFILINWSEVTRQDWFNQKTGEYQSVGEAGKVDYESSSSLDPSDPNVIWETPPFSADKAKKDWPERFEYTAQVVTAHECIEGLIHKDYHRIFNLHHYLEHHRIPHLFTMAHLGFKDTTGIKLRNWAHSYDKFDLCQFDWDDCFWNVYNYDEQSFVSWAHNNGYELTDGYHVPHEGHVEFAQVLYDYIQEHGILHKYKY